MNSRNNINSLLELLIKEISLEVSERIMFIVEEYLENKSANTPKHSRLLIDSDELAKQLSVSKSTIIKLRKEGLPTIYIGDSVRFNISDVFSFIKEKNKSTLDN